MIYNPDNGILYGITENCFNSFGINPNFVVGNFTNSKEFNIETIAPDLLLKAESLMDKNSNGS